MRREVEYVGRSRRQSGWSIARPWDGRWRSELILRALLLVSYSEIFYPIGLIEVTETHKAEEMFCINDDHARDNVNVEGIVTEAYAHVDLFVGEHSTGTQRDLGPTVDDLIGIDNAMAQHES